MSAIFRFILTPPLRVKVRLIQPAVMGCTSFPAKGIIYFPKGHTGNRNCSQFKQTPPYPMAAISARVIESPT
jgi:hypothetical protein